MRRPNPSEQLLSWYRETKRDLPWRVNPTPYRVWLSETMLQQTQVQTVIPYFERFLERFPKIEDLAAAEEDDVVAMWSGLGYYRRARSLRSAAGEIVERFGGEFPRDFKDALSLPGVGNYTASAVLSIAYGLPHAVVDGNVERVITRFHRLKGIVKSSKTFKEISAIAQDWLIEDAASDFNQSMMELGATVCTPKNPICDACPISFACEAFKKNDAQNFPELPPKRETVKLDLEVGIVERDGEYLLERPDDFGFLKGLWVFPLADVTEGHPGICASLSQRTGIDLEEQGTLPKLSHSITFRRMKLTPKQLSAEDMQIDDSSRYLWASRERIGADVPVSSICLKIIDRLEKKRSRGSNS